MNPKAFAKGLLLASAATHNPLPNCALASQAATSRHHDKVPVLAQHAESAAL
jgi:hypothetical protein